MDEPSETPDALLGTTIAGKFEIEASIGEGAMGRVYRARQISLDKTIAIKVLHKHLAMDPKIARRFHREARAASRLSHPNSLQIHDFGAADDGTLYIAMELLRGDDLQTVIDEDFPFSPARIRNILGQMLSALDEAHHAGIIHRDLKPENVVVLEGRGGEDERVKVCDFGIAKIQESEGGSAITISGFVCGTPEYMAPEQARGEELDSRADLYACGVMLYQMMTGKVPFTADTALGIITKHLTEQPVAPRVRRPDLKIPVELEQIAMKAMDKDRTKRFSSALEMKQALDAAVTALGDEAALPLGKGTDTPGSTTDISGLAPGGRPTTTELPVQSRGSVWAVALVVVLALGGFGAWVVFGGGLGGTTGGGTSTGAAGGGGGGHDSNIGTPPVEVDAQAPQPDAGAATLPAVVDAGPGEAIDAGRRRRSGHEPGNDTTQQTTQQTQQTQVTPPTPPVPPTPAQSPGDAAYDEGRRLFLANDVQAAIARFEEAARLMPRNAQVQKQLGRAYMRAGNVERGTAAYHRYLELAPNAPDRAIIERLLTEGH